MDFDTLALRSPDPRARQARPATPTKPAEVLAALMDFSGGVALAELLQEPAPRASSHPDATRKGHELLDRVQSQLDALSTRAQERLARERRVESDFTAVELFELTTQVVGAGAPRIAPDRALRLASELRRRVGWHLGATLRQALSELARLRTNFASEVRTLGARADQLERIDAALQTSVHLKLTGLYERVLRAAEQSFDRACIEACASLPEEFAHADFASWLAPNGFIARDRERCERTIAALCVHLRRAPEGLVMAAIQAEVGS